MADTRHAYDWLAGVYFPVAVAVFVLVVGTLVILLVRGRRRLGAPGRRSEALHLEIAWAVALACVAVFLVVITFRQEDPIDATVAHPALVVHVTAAQWSWRFSYPGGAVVADVSTWNPPIAEVPTDVEVQFTGTSEDVIHGFWVPQLHFQRQVLPGYSTRFDLIFRTPGLYGGQCSVFCGDRHSEMYFKLRAVPEAAFRRWLARQTRPGGSR